MKHLEERDTNSNFRKQRAAAEEAIKPLSQPTVSLTDLPPAAQGATGTVSFLLSSDDEVTLIRHHE